jgi:hypothetical protein
MLCECSLLILQKKCYVNVSWESDKWLGHVWLVSFSSDPLVEPEHFRSLNHFLQTRAPHLKTAVAPLLYRKQQLFFLKKVWYGSFEN